MNVVAKYGPVAVSVACLPWHFYQSGIFYAPMNSSITTTTDLDHLVVLEGYGTDVDTGEDYWLVRNSWGPRWREHGYIETTRKKKNVDMIQHPPMVLNLLSIRRLEMKLYPYLRKFVVIREFSLIRPCRLVDIYCKYIKILIELLLFEYLVCPG
jgi:Papain family cysteine protease